MAKADIITEKAKVKAQLGDLENREGTRFEPLMRFVKAQQRSHFIATHAGKIEAECETLKKTGSNLQIEEKTLLVDFQEPWKTVEKYGRLAHPDAALVCPSAPRTGEPVPFLTKAEEVGFEPTEPLRVHRFSRPAHSTALPLLRGSACEFSGVGLRGQNGMRWPGDPYRSMVCSSTLLK